MSKGNLQITDASWLVAQNPLTFAGTVGIAAEDPPLNLSVQGLVDLRVLSALTSAVAFDGNADVNTRIEGTVAKPLLDGRIMSTALNRRADPLVVLSDLDGAIVSTAICGSTASAAWPTAARSRSTIVELAV